MYLRLPQLPSASLPTEVNHADADKELWSLGNVPPSSLLLPVPTALVRPVTFSAFIETLPLWEQDLLRYVSFSVEIGSLSIELLRGFRAVSDGSTKEFNRHGSFGWVLSSISGTRLVRGMGPVRGRLVYPYRAEATGLLSVLRFLLRFREFTQTQGEWLARYSCHRWPKRAGYISWN